MSMLTVLLALLATYRATLLVTADRITQQPRDWLIARLPAGSRAVYLLDCHWCASMWVAALVAVTAWAWGDTGWWQAGALVLAGSAATGLLASVAAPEPDY